MTKKNASLFEESPEMVSNSSSSGVMGKVLLAVTGTLTVGSVALAIPFITPALRKICLPYVPATEKQIANVMKMCQARMKTGTSSRLADLGSGDGRVVSTVSL